MLDSLPPDHDRSWRKKFIDAGRGIVFAAVGQTSFVVHTVVAALVVAGGIMMRVNAQRWCLLVLCIAMVLAAETFNSALEKLVKVVHPDRDPDVGAALDMASGAVLLVSIGAAVVGCIVFLT